jgi:hypothetical protein
MHLAAPHSKISFDSDALAAPCSGNPPGNTSIDQVDLKALSEAVDFMVVMDCECKNAVRACAHCSFSG